jgi:hypothetical protein
MSSAPSTSAPLHGIELHVGVELLMFHAFHMYVSARCCMCFIWMLHVFHLECAKLNLVLHMLQWLYTYVVHVCFECFSCFKRIFANIFIWMLHMLKWLYMYVASVCFKCFTYFKRMLQQVLHVASVFISRPGKGAHVECFIWMLHMLQWLYTCVASVLSICYICCRGHTHMLHA